MSDTHTDFKTKVSAMCRRVLGPASEVTTLTRLTGGANMESWLIVAGERALVLRRLPPGLTDMTEFDRIDLLSEAHLIEAARKAGVTAPEIVAMLDPQDDLGSGFLMQKINGETLPHKIFRDDKFSKAVSGLTRDCARELAKIHALDSGKFTDILTAHTPLELVEALAARFQSMEFINPVVSAALHWLKTNQPDPREPCVLHGDFRMGNLMIDADGISGVLDWELAHIGDPAQDLGYLCTPSWRFGNYDKTVGGFGELDELLAAYEKESGSRVAKTEIRFWMIYASLWWASVCCSMTEFWRRGADKSLERIIIGRRVSECMVDILLMLEDAEDVAAAPLNWSLPDEANPSGVPKSHELLSALISWNSGDVIAKAKGQDLFQARVARNGLGMLQREARLSPAFERDHDQRLKDLGLEENELCGQLATGQLSLANPDILTHLRFSTLENLSIDQPKYAGLDAAVKKWT